MGPGYLAELLRYDNCTHVTRLVEPLARTHYGDRAFSKSGPKLWNKLPLNLKDCRSLNVFKSKLKTHLFRAAYLLDI